MSMSEEKPAELMCTCASRSDRLEHNDLEHLLRVGIRHINVDHKEVVEMSAHPPKEVILYL